MEGKTRDILWANLSVLMKKKYGRENLSKLRREAKVGSSALSGAKVKERSIGLIVLEKLAGVFELEPYELLMPELGATLMRWPFKRITRERLMGLSADDLSYVEGALDYALKQIESAGTPAMAATQQARLDAIAPPEAAPAAPDEASKPTAKHRAKK